jgi:hypothetical protein
LSRIISNKNLYSLYTALIVCGAGFVLISRTAARGAKASALPPGFRPAFRHLVETREFSRICVNRQEVFGFQLGIIVQDLFLARAVRGR